MFFISLDGDLTFDQSKALFAKAFCKAFPWEVLKVLSKPPYVLFTWRHWGEFVGEFQGNKGSGETIEMYGLLRVTVNDDLKIQLIEAFYDPDSFLEVLEGKKSPHELKNGIALMGDISKLAIEKEN